MVLIFSYEFETKTFPFGPPRGDCVTPQPGISRPVVRADAWWELEAHDATTDGMEPTMDWFSWGELQETPIFHGKMDGFRLRFSHESQSIENQQLLGV